MHQPEVGSIAIPEGTQILRYPAVAIDRRTGRVELQEDRVITGVGDRQNDGLGELGSLAVDESGRIYTVDLSRHRVVVFDHTGDFVGSYGRRGDGPGEMRRPGRVAVAGDRLWVAVDDRRRLVSYALEDSAATEVRDPSGQGVRVRHLFGDRDGSVIVGYGRYVEGSTTAEWDQRLETVLRKVDGDGSVGDILATIPDPQDVVWHHDGTTLAGLFSVPNAAVHWNLDARLLFLSPASSYDVLAMDERAKVRWVVRVPWHRQPFGENDREHALAEVREMIPLAQPSEASWPDLEPVIDRIVVDGRGRVHVYLYDGLVPPPLQAVDVYDADGGLIANAVAPRTDWEASWRDFVYAIRENELSGSSEIVRYRLQVHLDDGLALTGR